MRGLARLPFLAALVVAIVALTAPASAGAFGPLSSFGSAGEGAGQMDRLEDIAVAPDGNLYVADRGNNRVDVFSPQGQFLFAFGKGVNPTAGVGSPDICNAETGCADAVASDAAGGMNELHDLAIAPGGNVFVADSLNSRVDVFSPQGQFLYAFGKGVDPGGNNVCTGSCEAGEGVGAGGLSSPRGVALDSGRVYVVENASKRVSVFTEAGGFLFAFGKGVNVSGMGDPDVCTITGCGEGDSNGAGGLLAPHGIEIAAGRVYVANTNNFRIEVFSTAGEFLFAFGKEVNPNGGDVCDRASGCLVGIGGGGPGVLGAPLAVAADARGAIYVGGSGRRVNVFTPTGEFLRAFGLGVLDGATAFQQCTAITGCRAGALDALAPGSVRDPVGLAFDRDGALYVAEDESGKARVERFGEPPPVIAKPSNEFKLGKLRLNRKRGTATLAVTVPGPGALKLAGKGIRQVKRAAARAGTVKLTVRLAGQAKRKLLAAGKAKVQASVVFTPTGGEARAKRRALILKKTLRPAARR